MGDLMQAESFANIYDFCDMVKALANRAWGEDWGDMRPHFSSTEDSKNIPLPIITYEVIDRQITPERGEIKPQLRREVKDQETGEVIKLYGQWFDYILQFNIFDHSVSNVISLLENLENLILTYTGYFKQQGVSEILFHRQVRDDQLNKWDESLDVRSIRYKIRIENLQVVSTGIIKDININVNNKV